MPRTLMKQKSNFYYEKLYFSICPIKRYAIAAPKSPQKQKLSENDGKIDGNLLILNDGSQWVRRSKVQDALATDDNQLPF